MEPLAITVLLLMLVAVYGEPLYYWFMSNLEKYKFDV